MPVDEKYVERVVESEEEKVDYQDVLTEFGISASYKPPSNNGLNLDKKGYTISMLRELWAGDEYEGRPIISNPYADVFTDQKTGKETKRFKVDLVLLNDDFDERDAYIFPCNLSSTDFIVKNVSNRSGLYKLAMGLMELKAPGIHQEYNQLDIVNIKHLQSIVKQYTKLTVKVVEDEFEDKKTKEVTPFNSFKIVDGE